MYIKKLSIKNIRSIDHFEMEFKEPAGWHVIIGDNGSGKSTVVKTIAFCVVGSKQEAYLRQSPAGWLNFHSQAGKIQVEIFLDKNYDYGVEYIENNSILSNIDIGRAQNTILTTAEGEHRFNGGTFALASNSGIKEGKVEPDGKNTVELFVEKWGSKGWFSIGFGPFRKLSSTNQLSNALDDLNNIDYSLADAHLSLFDDSINFPALAWLTDLNYKRLIEKDTNSQGESTLTYNNILNFINKSNLLPHSVQIEGLNKNSIIFRDGNNNPIPILELSDGYRSILSLTFELIRQLVRVYGAEAVFTNIQKGQMYIDLPGVVLIDEVDAHLHPSWQTRIGQWFTKYFPNIQFIVTTHSPLVCRACEKGSIWHLAAPGSGEESGEITGIARKRLIYGNILDAYGTEAFGENVSISEDAALMRNRLGELYEKSMLGLITKKEEVEFQKLKAILPTFRVNVPKAQ